MTFQVVTRYAVRDADNLPVQEDVTYAEAGTEGTAADDPRGELLDLGDGEKTYIRMRTENALNLFGTHTLLADEAAFNAAVADYDAAVADARDDMVTTTTAGLSDASAAQFAAFSDIQLQALFTDPTIQFITRGVFPDFP